MIGQTDWVDHAETRNRLILNKITAFITKRHYVIFEFADPIMTSGNKKNRSARLLGLELARHLIAPEFAWTQPVLNVSRCQ